MTLLPPLLGQHAADALVAFGDAGPRTRAELLRDAGRIAAILPPPTAGSSVLLIARHDRYAAAAALLAIWSAGHRVALPPDTRRDSIWRAQDQPGVVAMLHDTDAGHAHRLADLLGGDGEPIEQPALDAAEVAFYAADATGQLTAHLRAARALIADARAVALPAGARLAATVPPGHPDGLICTVLAPLLTGAAFARETPADPDALADYAARHHVDALVTSPHPLRALAALDSGRLTVERVISTAAPLPQPLADALAARYTLIDLADPADATPQSALEATLTALDGVRDAAVVADPPLAALVADGQTPETLRAAVPALADHRVALVDAIPRDAVGALDRPRLLQHFGLDPAGRPFTWALRWLADEATTDGARHRHRFDAEVPTHYGWYTGHFPGYPILMGAVQLREIALRCARLARPALGELRAVHKLKFLDRICPGDTITTTLDWTPDRSSVDFRITRGETICSAGRLVFEPAP